MLSRNVEQSFPKSSVTAMVGSPADGNENDAKIGRLVDVLMPSCGKQHCVVALCRQQSRGRETVPLRTPKGKIADDGEADLHRAPPMSESACQTAPSSKPAMVADGLSLSVRSATGPTRSGDTTWV